VIHITREPQLKPDSKPFDFFHASRVYTGKIDPDQTVFEVMPEDEPVTRKVKPVFPKDWAVRAAKDYARKSPSKPSLVSRLLKLVRNPLGR